MSTQQISVADIAQITSSGSSGKAPVGHSSPEQSSIGAEHGKTGFREVYSRQQESRGLRQHASEESRGLRHHASEESRGLRQHASEESRGLRHHASEEGRGLRQSADHISQELKTALKSGLQKLADQLNDASALNAPKVANQLEALIARIEFEDNALGQPEALVNQLQELLDQLNADQLNAVMPIVSNLVKQMEQFMNDRSMKAGQQRNQLQVLQGQLALSDALKNSDLKKALEEAHVSMPKMDTAAEDSSRGKVSSMITERSQLFQQLVEDGSRQNNPVMSRLSDFMNQTTAQWSPLSGGLRSGELNMARMPTATSATYDVNMTLDQSVWGQQMATRLSWLASEGSHRATLKLNPPEFGPLEVRMDMLKDPNSRSRIHFITAQPMTSEMLNDNMSRLRDQLATMGWNNVEFDVSDGSLAHGFDQESEQPWQEGGVLASGIQNASDGTASDQEQARLNSSLINSLISVYA